MPCEKPPKRVVVIGSSCAGKTTFATLLATQLGLKHIELDALYWEPNWKEADDTVFRARVASALNSESWVVDGNYTNKIKDLVWPMANIVVWLDPPLFVILYRFLFRSLSRTLKGELLWGHSIETLKNNIFSRNSLLMWIITTHGRRTRSYLDLLDNPPKNVTVLRLRKDNQISDFVQGLSRRE